MRSNKYVFECKKEYIYKVAFTINLKLQGSQKSKLNSTSLIQTKRAFFAE